MITYSYTARDPATGKKVTGKVSASSTQEAAKQVEQQGLAVLEVNVSNSGGIFSFS